MKMKFLLGRFSMAEYFRFRYNSETLLMSMLLKDTSPAAYELLREHLSLPGKTRLCELSKDMNCSDNQKYLLSVFDSAAANERIVAILFDEVYMQPKVSYSNGHSSCSKLTRSFKLQLPSFQFPYN
jgi:hypothetical protein